MRVRKITSLQKRLCYLLFLLTTAGFAQSVTNSPQKVTHRTSMTINGTGFTTASTVRFYTAATTTADYSTGSTAYVSPLQTTYVSATELRVIIPQVLAANTPDAVRYFRVVTGSTYTAAKDYTYIAPWTIANSGVSEVVTNWNNGSTTFWKSTSASNVSTQQPDNSHSMMGFRYGGNMYSTGNESNITNILNAAGYTAAATGTGGNFITGNYRALPIKDILGTVPSSGPNLIVLGSKVDGSANTQIPTAPNVTGLSIRDVLIDGTRGLNLGTGTTNLPSTAVLTFEATNIITNNISDGMPDIIVSQIAEPTDNSYSVYSFIDNDGNIVGHPVQVAFNSVNVIGRYKSDFFTLPVGQPLNTAQVNGSMLIGATTRDVRMVAYKIGDFGITGGESGNAANAKKFKVMPSGTSDPAFMAYNRNRFLIPAPEITAQPSSQGICPGGNATFLVTVASTSNGTETPTFQWEKNGVPISDEDGHISGTTTNELTINPILASDAGAYRCLISNASGSALSNNAYLNTIISAGPDAATCQNNATAPTLEVSALGNTPTYQWYSNIQNNNTTGTIINGATSATYAPPVNVAGLKYYYVKSHPQNVVCAEAVVTSAPMEYNVVATAVGGTVSPQTQAVCPGGNAYITLSDYTGTIQWQYASTNSTNDADWTNISSTTTATYNTPSLYIASVSATTYYRAKITSGCGNATSQVAVINTNDNFSWTGNINTDWSLAANWSCNSIPTLSTTVTIPAGVANYPHVYTITGLAKNVTIEEGASITVDAAGKLQVDNNFTAADNTTVTITSGGTLEVKNAVNVAATANFTVQNNAALVQVNTTANTGNITVKRRSNALYRLDYTFWSSPVSGQNLVSFSPATSLNPIRFYTYGYDGTLEQYLTIVDAVNTSFAPARGYLIRMPNTDPTPNYNAGTATLVLDGTFTGVPHNGTYQPPLNLTNAASQVVNQAGHYYGVGNPYPSPISVAAFFNDTDNQSRIANGSALYFWRKKNDAFVSSYATLTLQGFAGNGGAGQSTTGGQENAPFYPANTTEQPNNNQQWIISPGQGFIVKLAAGVTENVVFKNSMRRAALTTATATTGQPFFKTSQNGQPSRYWVNLSDVTGAYSQALVGYSDAGTLDVDYGYDGFEINQGSSIRFFSKQDENNFTVQARPEFEQTDIVKMGFAVTAAGQYTVSLDEKDGIFAEGQQIYLKDNMLGTTHNLADGDYSFSTDLGTFTDRFEIVYTTQALGNIDFEAGKVYVYKENNTNTINVTSGQLELTGIKVFDIRGRELHNAAATGNQASVSLNIAQQVVIVEVTTTAGKVTKKVIF